MFPFPFDFSRMFKLEKSAAARAWGFVVLILTNNSSFVAAKYSPFSPPGQISPGLALTKIPQSILQKIQTFSLCVFANAYLFLLYVLPNHPVKFQPKAQKKQLTRRIFSVILEKSPAQKNLIRIFSTGKMFGFQEEFQ